MLLASARSCCRHRQWALLRTYSDMPPLPPQEKWRGLFPATLLSIRDRFTVRNPDTAAKLADAFFPEGQRDKVVLEAFPGPGTLTRALLNLPKERIRKIIVMEDYEPYLEYLRPLAAYDSRIKLLEKRGLDWDTYQIMEEEGFMEDVSSLPWKSGLHPNLHFISHIPQTTQGEQFVAQLMRCVPDESWLFRYGRVPLTLLMAESMWKRVSAPVGHKQLRCKVSVMAEAVSTSSPAIWPGTLQPYDEHFHPASSLYPGRPGSKSPGRKVGTPVVAVNLTPAEHVAITSGMLDKWDYVLRRLFVLKSTPLSKAISSLSPGADALLEPLTSRTLPPSERVDVTKDIRHLTVEDWGRIVKAFDEWPFAPQDLMISDAFSRDIEKE